jgi:hypothetical protein
MKSLILYTLTGVMFLISNTTSGQEVVVSLTKMNTLYRTLENPVRILIENQPAEKVTAKARYGSLTPGENPSEFWYYIEDCDVKEDRIIVGIKNKNGVKWIDTTVYRIKSPPPPVLYVCGIRSGGVSWKEMLMACPVLSLGWHDILMDEVRFQVDTFSVEVYRNDSMIFSEYRVPGYRFSPKLMQFIADEEPGYSLMFFDIRGSGPGSKCWPDFDPVTIRVKPLED